MPDRRPEVLFVCVHNAGRSQMAAALLTHYARRHASSCARRALRPPRRSIAPWSKRWLRSASTSAAQDAVPKKKLTDEDGRGVRCRHHDGLW